MTITNLDRFEKFVLGAGLFLCILLGWSVHEWWNGRYPFGIRPGQTPYGLIPNRTVSVPPEAYNGRIGPAFGLVNYRGTAFPSLVRAGNPGITGYEDKSGRLGDTSWQFNLDPDFVWSTHNAYIAGGFDLDGDGREEIVYYCRSRDGSRNEVAALDPLRSEVIGRVSLKSGPDRRADGNWDGVYMPFGQITYQREDGTETQALMVGCRISYDAIGRGVLALDMERGEVLWRFDLAGSPLAHNMHVCDLDGDGRKEIVIGTNGPDNLPGQRINGMSDGQVMALVLSGRGELLWARVLAPRSCRGLVQVADLDGDGRPEVVTGAASIGHLHSEVVVWDGMSGRVRAKKTLKTNLTNMRILADESGLSRNLILSTLHDGFYLLQAQDGRLELVDQVLGGRQTKLSLAGDILPPPGEEVVASITDVGLFLLDAQLHPLAVHLDKTSRGAGETAAWKPNEDLMFLLCSREKVPCMEIRPRSIWARTDFRPAVASLGGLALLSGGLVLRRRQRSFYRQRLDMSDPNILRELRLRLLSDLELSGHGAVGILRSLRRLIWNLETRASGIGESMEMTRRLDAHWKDFRRGVLPHVRDILSLAGKAEIAPHAVAQVSEAMTDLEDILGTLAQGGFEGPAIEADVTNLQRCSEEAEAGMQKIRRSVEELFRADWTEAWNRVLRARADDLKKARVRVEQEGPQEEVFCRLDPRQLEFMLDNLVGNAVRAMVESADPCLTITTHLEDGMVIGEVQDTGWGIAPEDWDRIMETPYSSRDGGGLGLFETQRVLRLFGGRIAVKESRAGVGTVLRLVVPLARHSA